MTLKILYMTFLKLRICRQVTEKYFIQKPLLKWRIIIQLKPIYSICTISWVWVAMSTEVIFNLNGLLFSFIYLCSYLALKQFDNFVSSSYGSSVLPSSPSSIFESTSSIRCLFPLFPTQVDLISSMTCSLQEVNKSLFTRKAFVF